jgi:putative membrane protein
LSGNDMDPMWGMWGMGGMMLAMVVFWLALLAAIGVGVWWLVRVARTRQDGALEALRERYARGEITREEFEARRRDLSA